MLRSRPHNDALPDHWPSSRFNDHPAKSNVDEIHAAMASHTSLLSTNINIILCLTALIESDLESLLVACLGEETPRDEFGALSVSLLREELIRLSSLDKYLDYFDRLYGAKPREIIPPDSYMALRLLFNVRNLIIHASALRGQVVREQKFAYILVNDPFYLDIVKVSATLLRLPSEFYCLPESLLGCNRLIDILVARSQESITLLMKYIVNKWPSLKPDCYAPGLKKD